MTGKFVATLAFLLPLCAAVQAAAPAPASVPGDPATPSRTTGAQAIREEGFVRIGHIDQWVTISGASRSNPVVLFLHGGPGNTMSPYAAAIYGAWENEFTLVQWDQRGAGKTFGRNPQTAESELDVAQMARDGIELATYLTRRLGQDKVVLMGGSWGSLLGVHMAKARPDLFHAYVGTGQLVSYGPNQTASYETVLGLARAADDTSTLSALEALGPPPWSNPRAFGVLRRATRAYEAKTAAAAPGSWWVPAPEYATTEAQADYEAGEDYSYLQFVGLDGNGMFSRVDLPELGATFDLPVYLVQGSEDLVTVPEVAKRYFDTIEAPHKEYVLVPHTGHDPNIAMVDAQYEAVKAAIARSRKQ